MNARISGINGTVGRVVATTLRNQEHRAEPLPRESADMQPADISRMLNDSHADAVIHLAIASKPTGRANEHDHINVEWPARLAAACATAGVQFLFTSTAMVFSDHARGPFKPDHPPDASEGYGHQKLTAERLVRAANPDAVIVRLGWQIGDAPGGNQMLSYFDQNMREHGVVRASRKWLPACSFLDETANALIRLTSLPGGIYQVDSNTRWNFSEIASALTKRAGAAWRIEPTDDFDFDQRLLDDRTRMPPLSDRLPDLSVD